MRRLSSRQGSRWRHKPEVVGFARAMRAIAILKAGEAREHERDLQAALAAERMRH